MSDMNKSPADVWIEVENLREQLAEAKRVTFDPKVLERMNELEAENATLKEWNKMLADHNEKLAQRGDDFEEENAALKESNEYAWRNTRTIDAARMEVEKKFLAAQHRIKELREALEHPDFSSAEAINLRVQALATPDNTAEIDALVKDAERYCYLRKEIDCRDGWLAVSAWNTVSWDNSTGEELDAAIDAAMKEGK